MSVTGNAWQPWPLLVAKTNHSTPPEATRIFMRLFLSISGLRKDQHISLIVSAVLRKRSRLPGVIITQYVTSIPEGKSTPDFTCKLAPVTVEEGGRPQSEHGWNVRVLFVTLNAHFFQGKQRFFGSGSKVIPNQTCHGKKQKEPFQRTKHFRSHTMNPPENIYSRWAGSQ